MEVWTYFVIPWFIPMNSKQALHGLSLNHEKKSVYNGGWLAKSFALKWSNDYFLRFFDISTTEQHSIPRWIKKKKTTSSSNLRALPSRFHPVYETEVSRYCWLESTDKVRCLSPESPRRSAASKLGDWFLNHCRTATRWGENNASG